MFRKLFFLFSFPCFFFFYLIPYFVLFFLYFLYKLTNNVWRLLPLQTSNYRLHPPYRDCTGEDVNASIPCLLHFLILPSFE